MFFVIFFQYKKWQVNIIKNTKNIIKNKKTANLSEEEKGERQKKVSRKTSISSWRLKVETTRVYEKLLFST